MSQTDFFSSKMYGESFEFVLDVDAFRNITMNYNNSIRKLFSHQCATMSLNINLLCLDLSISHLPEFSNN